MRGRGFTLIELLIVIGIIAILSVVIILVLNPYAILQQSRDSNRVADMADLTSALGVYTTQLTTSIGSENMAYVSIPDPSATSTLGDQCQGLGLPTLPSTYSYHCSASSTFRAVNGNGWIPVNFTALSGGSPFGSLPIDPTNTSSSRLYYTYTTNGSQYEVTASMESSKYQLGGSNDVVSTDGGTLVSVYEKGSQLGLEPIDYGDNSLVGYWTFGEGTGTILYDYSGDNATGSWFGAQTGAYGYYGPSQAGGYSGNFNGVNDYIEIPSSSPALNSALKITGDLTISAWINPSVPESGYSGIINHRANNGAMDYGLNARTTGIDFTYHGPGGWYDTASGTMSLDNWHFVAITRSNNGTVVNYYIDGAFIGNGSGVGIADSLLNPIVFGEDFGHTQYFQGLIDDVRVYNRAFSASQILSLYGKR